MTKSDFLAGMECRMRLWFAAHPPDNLPGPGPVEIYRMKSGIEVGREAWNLFPGGRSAENGDGNQAENLETTMRLVEDENVPAIFEGSFLFDNILIRADILQRLNGGRWNLVEVKSSTGVNKEKHLWDVWIQYYVLSRLGFELEQAGILHLNRNYRYDGNSHNYSGLFAFFDLKPEIDPMNNLLGPAIDWFKDIIKGPKPELPELDRACKECGLSAFCRDDIPDDWVAYLPRLSSSKWDLLASMNIREICKIPSDFSLTPTQNMIRGCVMDNVEYVNPDLGEQLGSLKYPLYFLDFETVSTAIPRLSGTCPYQVIPFQWSCHILRRDNSIDHNEFLHDRPTDPRIPFIESLLNCLGDEGSILHYTSFEKVILSNLAKEFPVVAGRIEAIGARLVDQCRLIMGNYYHPAFKGSYSIKQVLPAMFSDDGNGWSDLDIKDGSTAMAKYLEMISPDKNGQDRDSLRESLLRYCEQDTWAMVRIHDYLQGKV